METAGFEYCFLSGVPAKVLDHYTEETKIFMELEPYKEVIKEGRISKSGTRILVQGNVEYNFGSF